MIVHRDLKPENPNYAAPEGGNYTSPCTLSAGERDLIPRMLVVDPVKRMIIPEIHQHPWSSSML
ncbi:hypothetical protein C5167_045270 [Papaver somniferum]|uniref:Protein kinase domain-containing protein n=1 Tax=Papaver somniferum TaxID=3469 RepID=A0A4Y7LE53_PAPSO|nr:hypothetical protein C5167_045270 [Papaver somniferum]